MVLFPNELISESGVINMGDMQNVGGPQDWNLEPVDKRAWKIRVKKELRFRGASHHILMKEK